MAQLRIGTCSWKYPSWEGLVYSARGGISYLEEYARHYDTVEVDQWFWSLFGDSEPKLPRPMDVEEYRRAVPDTFRFSVKVPNSLTLTHLPRAQRSAPLRPNPHFLSPELFLSFWSRLQPMAAVLGPVIFQFEYLNRDKMQSQEEFEARFDDFLLAVPRGPQYALEVRNASYLNEAFFEFLHRPLLIPVLLQGYWMPDLREVWRQWRSELVRHRTVVLRLHGPNREEMERLSAGRWDRRLQPRDEELRAIAEMTQDLLSQGVNVYINVNNHFEGSAPLSIARLLEFMQTG